MKNKYKIQSITIFLIAVLFMSACTDGFEEINTNPNRVTFVEPEYVFGLTPIATFRELTGNNNWFFFANYSQLWAVEGGGGPHFGYDGRSDRIWNNLYVATLNPLYSIIRNYGDNPAYTNRVAIARIWRAYTFSILVGLYGPCPYTDACNGQPSIQYDKEEDIYHDILKELKEAYTALNPANANDKYPAEAEPFLKSDLNRWSQFAHCIRLRTAMRVAEVDANYPAEEWAKSLAAEARAIVAEELDFAENGALINSNDGNFYMTFGEDLDNQNPLYKEMGSLTADALDNNLGNLPVIHESLMLWIKPTTYNDPAWKVLVVEGDGGTRPLPVPTKYLGRPNSMGRPTDYRPIDGYKNPYDNAKKYSNFATIGREFWKMTANFYFFSYAELCFLRAEATLKGYWNKGKSAEEYYYEGIDARCLKYKTDAGAIIVKQADIDKYKSSAGIKWSTPTEINANTVETEYMDYLGGFVHTFLGGEEDNFKRIVLQHWISLFGQNVDAYTLLRRTEVLQFKPHFDIDQNNGYVGEKWGYIPQRITYPGSERTTNSAATRIAILDYLYDNTLQNTRDQVTFRLIFAKDNPGLPAPPEGTMAYYSFPYPLPNRALNRIGK
jgi:hypothetical protein